MTLRNFGLEKTLEVSKIWHMWLVRKGLARKTLTKFAKSKKEHYSVKFFSRVM